MTEEDTRQFEVEVGMRRDPDQDALDALRAHQEAAGIVIENPDAPVGPDAKAMAMAEDEELGGTWMGGPRRG
jgi:hypothetical protein